MNTLVLVIVALLFSAYGIVCAIECGAGLALLNPKLSSEPKDKRFPSSSLWLITTLLTLVLTFVLYVITKNTYLPISHYVYDLLIIGILANIIKLLSTNYLGRKTNQKRLQKFAPAYLIGCYLYSVSLGSIGIYFVTGKQFWSTIVGWTLIVSLVLGITLVGLSMQNRNSSYDKRIKLRQCIDLTFAGWLVALGFAFPLSLQHYNSSLIGVSMSILEIVIVVSLLAYAFVSFSQKKPHELYQYALIIGFAAPILLALNNRPYLLTDRITIAQAFKSISFSQSYFWLVYLFLGLGVILILLSIYITYKFLEIKPVLKFKTSTHK